MPDSKKKTTKKLHTLECTHLRYNFEKTPREDQSTEQMRVHLVGVSEDSPYNIISKIVSSLRFTKLDNSVTGDRLIRGRVRKSSYWFEFRSYDVQSHEEILGAIRNSGILAIKDENMIELRRRYKCNQYKNEPTSPSLGIRISRYYEGKSKKI